MVPGTSSPHTNPKVGVERWEERVATHATRSLHLTDEEIDVDVARLITIHRNRRTIGYGYTPRRPPRPAREPKQHVIQRRTGVHDFSPVYLAAEAELLERILSDALASMDRRDRQAAKVERRRHRRRQRAWMAGTWAGVSG